MERAKVFVVGGNDNAIYQAVGELESAGHEVRDVATGLAEALAYIDGGRLMRDEISVVILEGNLEPDATSCDDGRRVAEAIRHAKPDVKIIAYSTCPPDVANYGDAYCDGTVGLGDVVASL